MYVKGWFIHVSYAPKALTEFGWNREEGHLTSTAVCRHGRHHAKNIYAKQRQLFQVVADARQGCNKKQGRHCELGQIVPMGLTFCAREWQLLK